MPFNKLAGTYVNKNANATLVIQGANDGNGQITGTLTQGGRTYNFSGGYHYQNGGPDTGIAFFAGCADVGFQAWSLYTNDGVTLLGMGSSVEYNGRVTGLGGAFVRT